MSRSTNLLALVLALVAAPRALSAQETVVVLQADTIQTNELPAVLPLPTGSFRSTAHLTFETVELAAAPEDILVWDLSGDSLSCYDRNAGDLLFGFLAAFADQLLRYDPDAGAYSIESRDPAETQAALAQPGVVVFAELGLTELPLGLLNTVCVPSGSIGGGPGPIESPTTVVPQTRTRTPTGTATPTGTRKSFETPSPTTTPTPAESPGQTPVATPTATATPTVGVTALGTATHTPTVTTTSMPTSTATPSPTDIVTETPTNTPSMTPTRSQTSTHTPTHTLTPTPTLPVVRCRGDCDDGGTVSVDEIVVALNVALGFVPLSSCLAIDQDENGLVTVDELISAVADALLGCPEAASRLDDEQVARAP